MATTSILKIKTVMLDGEDISRKVSGVETSWKPGCLEYVKLEILAAKVTLTGETIEIETIKPSQYNPQPIEGRIIPPDPFDA
jgi:hypothetical protein